MCTHQPVVFYHASPNRRRTNLDNNDRHGAFSVSFSFSALGGEIVMRNLFLSILAFPSLQLPRFIFRISGELACLDHYYIPKLTVGFSEHWWMSGWMNRCIGEFKVVSTDEFIPHAHTVKALHLRICSCGSKPWQMSYLMEL